MLHTGFPEKYARRILSFSLPLSKNDDWNVESTTLILLSRASKSIKELNLDK